MKPGLLAKVSSGIILIDPDTHNVADINNEAVAILGIPREVILNQKCVSSVCLGLSENCPFSPTDDPEFPNGEYLVNKSNEKAAVTRSFSEITLDGKRFIVECLIDISDRKKAEIELKNQKELLYAVYENASVGMALLDMNGNFYQVNQALCEMVQYTEEELLSRKYPITHPDDLERTEFVMAQLKVGKIRKNIMEKRYVRKDGTVIFVLHNFSMIRDNNGNPYLFIVQAQEITKMKEAMQKAVQADHLKSTFLQNLSHEIRTPANAIFGFFQLMKDPECSLEDKMEYIEQIRSGIEQFMLILNNIIDISKIETHQFQVNKQTNDIISLLTEVFTIYSAKFNMLNLPGIEFTLYMTETAEPVLVECDKQRLMEALGFLLDNAIKFTKFGRITLGCHVISGKEVIMFVKDTGIGISEEKQEYIFNKFRQGDESSRRQYGGLGLGLTLAKEFIVFQGGRMWLQSEPDKGTSVYCSLPHQEKSAALKPGHDSSAAYEMIDLSGKSILVAEDIESNFILLSRWLRKANARVIWAKNGLEAIEICHRDDTIDMILMDIQMPIVNGFDATRDILGFRPGLPIIAQTAYSLDFDERRALEAGCVAYLVKPLDISHLFSVIKTHIR